MKPQLKVSLLLVVGVGVVIAALLAFGGKGTPDAGEDAPGGATDPRLMREDSRVLGERGSSDVVLVEFLDFECEACRAAYPIVEDLRDKYGDRVTFVDRFLTLRGHINSERAARSVEAA